MTAFRLTPDARSDLANIHRFTLERWSKAQSEKYLSELRLTLHLLAETPSLCKVRPDIGSGVFSFPYASHIIYVILHGQQLVVFGILHKRMVPLDHLTKRETK